MQLLFKSISLLAILFISNISFAQDSTVSYNVAYKSTPLKVERLALLSEPWGMTFMPDGSLLVTEKPGRLRIYNKGILAEPISGLPEINYRGQGGLLDVEIDPDFAKNKFIYIYYTESAPQPVKVLKDIADKRLGDYQDLDDTTLKGGVVARAILNGNALADVKIIWRQFPKQTGRGHFGGRLVFAPDGKLFITSGERQRFDPAQSLIGNLGKIVRINTDGSIPNDNYLSGKKGLRSDIYSLGHRNALGAAINPATNKLWINEMGPLHGDELNIVESGKNYGWPLVSNGNNYNGLNIPDHETNPKFKAPIYYWHPSIAPSGLLFYNGSLFNKWQGNAVVGSLLTESLIILKLKGDVVMGEDRININKRVRDVIQAPDGSIWVLTDYKDNKGELLRISPLQP